MLLEIICPTSLIYSEEVNLVQLPGSNGSFELLNNHMPIISTLEKGVVKVIDIRDKVIHFEITGGIVECSSNKVSLLLNSGIVNQS